MRDFWINVAAGIFLTVITWVLVRILEPHYLAWRYSAPSLGGNWSFFDSDSPNAPAVGTAIIRQSGETLKASVVRTTSRHGKPVSRTFDYSGKVRDGQILLSFQEPTSKGFISGCLVLKISGDLKTLSGFTVYLDRDVGSVVAHPIAYRRA
jgi:hypothetical protein